MTDRPTDQEINQHTDMRVHREVILPLTELLFKDWLITGVLGAKRAFFYNEQTDKVIWVASRGKKHHGMIDLPLISCFNLKYLFECVSLVFTIFSLKYHLLFLSPLPL